MENEKQYFWNWYIACEGSGFIFLEHVASRVYGEFCAGDWTFDVLMDSLGAIHRLEGILSEEKDDTICTKVLDGYECQDRGFPVWLMCDGCRTYWERAAKLAGKPVEEYLWEFAR